MTRKQVYSSLCNQADSILIESGIRDICAKCSTEQGLKGWEKRPEWLRGQPGCCGGYSRLTFKSSCKHLGKNGCKTSSLSCKLWLCNKMEMEKMIDKIGKLKEWHNLEAQSLRYNFDVMRTNFKEIEEIRKRGKEDEG